MNAEGREIMIALQMITTVAQRYMARQEGRSQGGDSTFGDGDKGCQDNKRKGLDDKVQSRGGKKRQCLTTTVAAAPTPAKPYAGKLPTCMECNYHHTGASEDYAKCKRKGHTDQVGRMPIKTFCSNASHSCVECGNKEEDTLCQIPSRKQWSTTVLIPTSTMTPSPQKQYLGNLPKCNKCNFHHNGVCREMHCTNCNKKGHTVRCCKALTQANTQAANASVGRTCYECGKTGHFKRDCPNLKNRNAEGVGGIFGYGN